MALLKSVLDENFHSLQGAIILIFVLKGGKGSRSVTRTERKSSSKFIIPVSLSIILILLILNGYQFFTTKISSARNTELSSRFEKLLAESNYLESFRLYNENVGNPVLEKKLNEFSREVKIKSTNSDVKAYVKYDLDKLAENEWEFLCDVPCDVRIPIGRIKYRFETSGYKSFETLKTVRDSLSVDLIESDSVYDNMVLIKGRDIKLRVAGLDHLSSESVGNYQIDKYEVTNEDYAKFISNGGYNIDSLWKFKELGDMNLALNTFKKVVVGHPESEYLRLAALEIKRGEITLQ